MIRKARDYTANLIDRPNDFRAEDVFSPLLGQPAWFVQNGHGSFLTFEFGAPHLSIREPVMPIHSMSKKGSAILRRRMVVPRGEWRLWIYCCDWKVTAGLDELARSTSPGKKIEKATKELDGQILTSVEMCPKYGTSTFRFDLGGILSTWPYEGGADEQWMVFFPSCWVFSYRGDGWYSYHSSDEDPAKRVWQRLSLSCPVAISSHHRT